MEKPQTQNRNPNPNTREENGKKREGQEKKKEETPALLSPFAKRDVLSAYASGGLSTCYMLEKEMARANPAPRVWLQPVLKP